MAKKQSQLRMRMQKEAFLKALEKSLGNITMACREIGIERKTFYNWKDSDPAFRERYEEMAEVVTDFVESKFMQLINALDTTAVIFYLKTKGASRGYIEQKNIKADVQADIKGLNVQVLDAGTADELKEILGD